MAFEKHTKTEHGHRKDMAGKAWGGRTMIKEIISKMRRINEKKYISEEILEITENKKHPRIQLTPDYETKKCLECGGLMYEIQDCGVLGNLISYSPYLEYCKKCGEKIFI